MTTNTVAEQQLAAEKDRKIAYLEHENALLRGMVHDVKQDNKVLAGAVRSAVDQGNEKIKGGNLVLKVSKVDAVITPLKMPAFAIAAAEDTKPSDLDVVLGDLMQQRKRKSDASFPPSSSAGSSGPSIYDV